MKEKQLTRKDIGKHYDYAYKGIKMDPYRIFDIYRIHDSAIEHAIKKLLRAGKSVKDLKRDLQEVIVTLERKLEMLEEDESSSSTAVAPIRKSNDCQTQAVDPLEPTINFMKELRRLGKL